LFKRFSFFQSDFRDLRLQHDFLLLLADVNHVKEQLIEEWRFFYQNIIDRAVNQWRHMRDPLCKCILAKGGHFKHLM